MESTFWELGDLGVPFRFPLLTWERQFTKSVTEYRESLYHLRWTENGEFISCLSKKSQLELHNMCE